MKRARSIRRAAVSSRRHIILVPGFAGFDALGQLEYYAGVTPLFRHWKKAGGADRQDAVLHYFDNFPTAAVVIRAAKLRDYLAKRIARGEFLPGDSLALVGHSTGGLDIRRLIWDLAADYKKSANARYPVDGTHESPFTVSAGELLRVVNRIVFLSVPQFGTNFADWLRGHAAGRRAVVAELRASVAVSQVPLLDRLQDWISSSVATATRLDLMKAIQDALSEAETPIDAEHMQVALAQEAASELALWLRHAATDFGAIEDLAADVDSNAASPAHFDKKMRKQETDAWKRHHIRVRSYASVGTRPFDFDPACPSPQWDLLNPFPYPETIQQTGKSIGTDIVYRACYRACAGGPFQYPDIRHLPHPPMIIDEAGHQRTIAVWDNDGIVNSASMLWPNGRETLLVNADHMDIVGHFRLVRAEHGVAGRKYQSYDLLKSGSGFDPNKFAQVWNSVFDFCVS